MKWQELALSTDDLEGKQMRQSKKLVLYSFIATAVAIVLVATIWTGFDTEGLRLAFFSVGAIICLVGGGVGWGSQYGSHYHPDQPYDGMVGHVVYQDVGYASRGIKDGLAIALPGVLCVLTALIFF